MPINISRGRLTSDAVKGMLAKPEDREEAVAKLFKSVEGGSIRAVPAPSATTTGWPTAKSPTRRRRPPRRWPLPREAAGPTSRR